MAPFVDRNVLTDGVTVSSGTDFRELEAKWRDLETRSNPSFFQTWTWTGCLADERFPAPVLVEARESGRTVALALFNRIGRTLHLGQTGEPALDCVYIELNGVLSETGREADLTAACLQAARSGRSRLVLPGVSAASAAAAAKAGAVRYERRQAAPSAELVNRKGCFLDSLSANTRQQLRRSNRAYEAAGALSVDRADTPAAAVGYLEALAALHQITWTSRGHPGAFASPFFGRFHCELIARGMERGEIDILRISAGPQVIGYLYNFRYRGHSLAYQSGFDYTTSGKNTKPGLSCHYQAIRFARKWGALSYDFLAGDARYKRSLSDRAETLHWIEIGDWHSPRFLLRRAGDLIGAIKSGLPYLRSAPGRDMNDQ